MRIKIDALDTVNKLCNICQKYSHIYDVDVNCGRYSTDGASLLGVTSMLGREVEIRVIRRIEDSVADFDHFITEMISIGAYDR